MYQTQGHKIVSSRNQSRSREPSTKSKIQPAAKNIDPAASSTKRKQYISYPELCEHAMNVARNPSTSQILQRNSCVDVKQDDRGQATKTQTQHSHKTETKHCTCKQIKKAANRTFAFHGITTCVDGISCQQPKLTKEHDRYENAWNKLSKP